MSVSLPNGSTVSIASGYATAKTVTGTTNANPGVASSTAHGYTNGDYLEETSAWSKLTQRIIRVAGATTNDYQLEGIDTTSTASFPAGSGTGTTRKITGWTQLTQIVDSSSSGGEQQFETYQFLEGDRQQNIPTTKTPAVITFTIADDPTLAGYQLAKTANDDRVPRAILLAKSNGEKILYNAYVSLSTIPSLNVNKVMTVDVTLSLLSDPVRYAS